MNDILTLALSNPTAAVAMVQKYIGVYKPHVYELAQEVVEIMKDYADNTEYPATVAKIKKNMYDAYVEVGFTEDQALALMINDNIRLMENIKKNVTSSNKHTGTK